MTPPRPSPVPPPARFANARTALIGLLLGAALGLLTIFVPWVGGILIAVILLLVVGILAEIDMLSEIALLLLSWLWRLVDWTGRGFRGRRADMPRPARLAFALGVAAGFAAVLAIWFLRRGSAA